MKSNICRFIVCEGFNTPPFRAFFRVLNPESNTLPKQHTSSFRARLLILFLFVASPCFGQTLLGTAAGDFYSAFSKMAADEKKLSSLNILTPYIPDGVIERLKEDLTYRVAFIGFAANQFGIITGVTNSVGFAETLSALTGFLMVVEKSDVLEEWTIREISNRYEQLLSTSWRNVNSPLFTVMLEAYCSYKRGEIWQ